MISIFYTQKHINTKKRVPLYPKAYKMNQISEFVKTRRKKLGLTQEEFAEKAGVALTVIRKIEQGKDNLSLSKVNQPLAAGSQVRCRAATEPAPADALHRLHVAAIVQATVQKRRRHTQLAQLVHLVLHQRDQRRDDQGQAVEDRMPGS